MLTSLKVSYLACKRVFYRPKYEVKGGRDLMKLDFEGLKMQKLNIPTARAQRVDEENRYICLFLMFTPGFMVIKMSKMAHFFAFSADYSKK